MQLSRLFLSALCLGLAEAHLVAPRGTSSTTLPSATTTTSGSAVSTPSPIQTGMVSNCNKFYLVSSGDTCYKITEAQGISTDNFYAWNPAITTACTTLWVGYYVCVGVAPGGTTASPTPSATTNLITGTTTPTPTQSGMVSNCDKFYLVSKGDDCNHVAAAQNISFNTLLALNPAIGQDCNFFWPGYWVCVGTTGGTQLPSTTTRPTSTKATGPVSTPTPTQAGMVNNCTGFHLVTSGDTCYTISLAAGISLENFYVWNPAVGSVVGYTCPSLWAGYYVCISVS